MDREEILKRAQNVKKNQMDEMQEFIERSGCKYAVIFGGIACVVLMIAKIAAGVSWYDTYCIWAIMSGSLHLYTWKKTRARSALRLALAWLGVGILFGLCYIFEILR